VYNIFSKAIKICGGKLSYTVFVLRRGHAEAEVKAVTTFQICPLKGREGEERERKISFLHGRI